MKWTANADKELLARIEVQLEMLSADHLLEVINAAYAQIGLSPITQDIAHFISLRSRISILLDLMQRTDWREANTPSFWIDPQGKYRISLDD